MYPYTYALESGEGFFFRFSFKDNNNSPAHFKTYGRSRYSRSDVRRPQERRAQCIRPRLAGAQWFDRLHQSRLSGRSRPSAGHITLF
jgi:hypothetical protein